MDGSSDAAHCVDVPTLPVLWESVRCSSWKFKGDRRRTLVRRWRGVLCHGRPSTRPRQHTGQGGFDTIRALVVTVNISVYSAGMVYILHKLSLERRYCIIYFSAAAMLCSGVAFVMVTVGTFIHRVMHE